MASRGLHVPWSQIEHLTIAASEASLSVLLVLFYGGVLARYGILTEAGEKNITHLGAVFLLPCLLFTSMGPQSTLENLKMFWPLPVFCAAFMSCSFIYGWIGVRFFKMPSMPSSRSMTIWESDLQAG